MGKNIRRTSYEVAVLPWGATEAQQLSLTVLHRYTQADAVAAEAAKIAWEAGAKVAVLPAIPFGVQTGQAKFHSHQRESEHANRDSARVILSLAPHGIRKLVILNSHGGNCFKQIIRELQPISKVLLCQLNWWTVVKPATLFRRTGRSSLVNSSRACFTPAPEITLPIEKAGSGRSRPSKLKVFAMGSHGRSLPVDSPTEDTGVGDPKAATAAKGGGKKYFAALASGCGVLL